MRIDNLDRLIKPSETGQSSPIGDDAIQSPTIETSASFTPASNFIKGEKPASINIFAPQINSNKSLIITIFAIAIYYFWSKK